MKKLTVAIPNFNGGMNLQRAIESCRSIDLPENDFEILIVDNCSTDDSIKIINESKIKIPNIRLIENQENVGRIGNWNVCLKEAEGKYLIFLFTNDFIKDQNNFAFYYEGSGWYGFLSTLTPDLQPLPSITCSFAKTVCSTGSQFT